MEDDDIAAQPTRPLRHRLTSTIRAGEPRDAFAFLMLLAVIPAATTAAATAGVMFGGALAGVSAGFAMFALICYRVASLLGSQIPDEPDQMTLIRGDTKMVIPREKYIGIDRSA